MSKQYPYFISLDEAVNICNEYQIKLSTETISISNALSRVLATSVIAKLTIRGLTIRRWMGLQYCMQIL